MGNSLQDQLLKANLANKKQAKKAKTERHQARKSSGGKKKGDSTATTLSTEQAEKMARDRELNRARQEAAKQKSIAAQVRQMVEANALSRKEGETAYRFIDGKRVKTLYVTAQMQAQLASGSLMVAKLGEQYEVIPKGVAEKIRERDPSAIIEPLPPESPADEADEYAAYEVPDDLIW